MNSTLLFDRPGSALIEVFGKDAAAFLHNLSTNNIKALAVGQGCEVFFCTHTARVVAHGIVTRMEDERFWIDADAAQRGTLFRHLDRHFISEQIELNDRSDGFEYLRIVGDAPPAAASLEPLEIADIESELWCRRFSGWTPSTFDVIGAPAKVASLRQRLLDAGGRIGDEATAETLRIESGWPKFGVDMDSERFVVELNRIASSISYAKGCYLGQEPIVMARDRGQVNRKFLGLRLGSAEPPAAGSKVTKDNAEIGVVTSAIRSPLLGETIALAYLRRGNWDAGVLVSVNDSPATISALPF
ncbi:MAG: glycine cleavage T C-terminal barrel domain-containing protein [Gemmataceae bacterium]